MKNIILLTSKYPYGEKETFINSELKYLIKESNLYIYPSNLPKEGMTIRDLDFTINLINSKNNSNKIISFFKTIFCFDTYIEFINQVLKTKNIFKSLKYVFGYNYRAYNIEHNILSKFKRHFKENPQNYVLYSYWFLESALAISRISKKYNIKAITRAHRVDLYEGLSTYPIMFREITLKYIDSVHPISLDGTNYIKNKYKNTTNTFTYYLGTSDYGYKEKDKFKDYFHIVSCSRVVPVKRVDFIIDILKNIREYSIKWTHIGGGSLFEDLKNNLSDLNENIVVNLLGDKDHNEVIDFYKQEDVDLFINVSSSEGLPVSIMEAISFGIPVIATNVGGTSEIVKDNVTGFLVELETESQNIANLIELIINYDDKTYQNLRKNSRDFWYNNFNSVQNYKKFIEEITNENKAYFKKNINNSKS